MVGNQSDTSTVNTISSLIKVSDKNQYRIDE